MDLQIGYSRRIDSKAGTALLSICFGPGDGRGYYDSNNWRGG